MYKYQALQNTFFLFTFLLLSVLQRGRWSVGECVSNFGDQNLICSRPHAPGRRREYVAELRTMIAGEDEMTCCLNLPLITALKYALLVKHFFAFPEIQREKKLRQNRWFPHPMTAKVLVRGVNTRVIKDHVRKRSLIQFCCVRQLTGNVSA